jgi:chorismate synthase
MLRWLTAGESHGPALVAILEGLPAHVAITSDDIGRALARRRLGKGRGARMRFEQDEVTILGGVRHGRTMGGPVAIGFIAARTRSTSPVDMPPSVPPDRPPVRRMPASVGTISS